MMGEAEAGPGSNFESGLIHRVVAVVRGSQLEAETKVAAELAQIGFLNFRVQQAVRLPIWRVLAVSEQGQALRRAWRKGSEIWVSRDDNRAT